MSLRGPFVRGVSRYYANLGTREARAYRTLEPLQGDGVVGAMSAQWKEWRAMGAPRLLVQWLRNGVPLRWSRKPRQEVPLGGRPTREVEGEMDKLVEAGAFVHQRCEVVSPTFTIPKRDGSLRLIHDLRQINRALDAPKFTLRGAKEAADVVRNSEFLVALDLKRGYQQVAVAAEARKFLGAAYRGGVVASTVLPFGLAISPYVFTRFTNWLGREIRKRFGLFTAVYIDDFLLGARTKEELESGLARVKDFFKRLGVVLSEKTEHTPRRQVEYLGFVWDAAKKEVGITAQRRREYLRRVKNLLRCPQSRRTWQQLVGKLLFLREAVGPTLRRTRSLMKCMRSHPGEKLISPEGEAREDLLWWADKLRSPFTLSVVASPVSATLATDASDVALGAVLETWTPRFHRETGPTSQEVSREVLQKEVADETRHINVKEIEALLEALKRHQDKLSQRQVIWYSDSTTARAAIARQGTQALSKPAWDVTKQALDLAQELGITIIPRQVPGRLNCKADSLSRPGGVEEMDLWREALERLALEWGPAQEDPFGFRGAPTSIFETLEWSSRRTLLVPPVDRVGRAVSLLQQVVAKEMPSGPPSSWDAVAMLVTPLWKGAAWWPALAEMRRSFLDLGRIPHPRLERWKERNGHWPNWTVSLIPTRSGCGQTER